ncbi:MAG: cysteine--tRNA ligase [Candidatus Thermochlorobacter aerophilum]|jgi:cysteinyl-tRNA synthetase|uniref:Cysteine--tRNA ligase n=1 Tax=Candidatus Thermochlorobacter aerophilus TaxID=1868324 RepID=A0A395LY43_9BACT|nr:MAG: cysteine--tRNA ligase [Candidatus Thermochlorobacter aerophilum]
MSLKIYNSLTRQKEVFTPLVPGHVGIYVCGPTVYGHSHIGHAKSYVSFDVVVRWLRHLGYKVKYVQNITDVGHLTDNADEGEDKIVQQARRERLEPMEIAQAYTRSFYEDMDALGVLRPNIAPTASGHIPEQIELIKTLIAKGYAYEVNGSVYFDVSAFAGYGKLSGRTKPEELEAGKRVAIRSEKRNPSDFALWKKAEPNHIMKWPSPWGWGYPGWHIECSAMSMKYLGETFDIHGGGLENQFPHHECEIAQSEAATGKPFVRYWMHNNMVTVNGVKMGKSLGNFTTIKDVLKKFKPTVLRFFILQSHYRSTLDFSDSALQAAKAGWEKLQETYMRLQQAAEGKGTIELQKFEQQFCQAMNDDFNSPLAIATLFDLSREINSRLANEGLTKEAKETTIQFFHTYARDVLGIISTDTVSNEAVTLHNVLQKVMELVLEIRQEARARKDFTTSDRIRDKLKAAGVEVKDTKDGATWRLIS